MLRMLTGLQQLLTILLAYEVPDSDVVLVASCKRLFFKLLSFFQSRRCQMLRMLTGLKQLLTILLAYEVTDSGCGFSCQLQRVILLTFLLYLIIIRLTKFLAFCKTNSLNHKTGLSVQR